MASAACRVSASHPPNSIEGARFFTVFHRGSVLAPTLLLFILPITLHALRLLITWFFVSIGLVDYPSFMLY
jgi:hypothetical protein